VFYIFVETVMHSFFLLDYLIESSNEQLLFEAEYEAGSYRTPTLIQSIPDVKNQVCIFISH